MAWGLPLVLLSGLVVLSHGSPAIYEEALEGNLSNGSNATNFSNVSGAEDEYTEEELQLLEYCEQWKDAPIVYGLTAPIWLVMTTYWAWATYLVHAEVAYDLHRLLFWVPLVEVVHGVLSIFYFWSCPWVSLGSKVVAAMWVVLSILKDPIILVCAPACHKNRRDGRGGLVWGQIGRHTHPSPGPAACRSADGLQGLVRHAHVALLQRDRRLLVHRDSPLRGAPPSSRWPAAPRRSLSRAPDNPTPDIAAAPQAVIVQMALHSPWALMPVLLLYAESSEAATLHRQDQPRGRTSRPLTLTPRRPPPPQSGTRRC